jgi:predicted MFS family arabinose efflux permease
MFSGQIVAADGVHPDVVQTPQRQTNRALLLAVIVVVVGVLATSLPQTQVLGAVPIRNLLKNAMHASRESSAAFVFWVTLPWYFKPLVGMVQDAFPIWGTRRKSYMLVGSVLATVAWLALDFTPYAYRAFLITCFAINFAMMVTLTAVGGYMVEIARANASSGRLTAVNNAVIQATYIISGVASGYLASIDFTWTPIACGMITFLLVPVAIWCLNEQRATTRTGTQIFTAAGGKLAQIGKARALWLAAAVAFLFYFSPGIQTAQFYAQQNDLHLTTQQQGNLISMAGACGVLGAFLYGAFAAKRFKLRYLLIACIVIGASSQAAYVFYNSYAGARFIDSFNGFGFTLTEVAMMHVAVRATPAGCESLGFAILIGVRNFGVFGGDWLGAALQDHFHLSFHTLAAINAAGSLLAIPVALLIPAAIVMGRDGEKVDPGAALAVDAAAIPSRGGIG